MIEQVAHTSSMSHVLNFKIKKRKQPHFTLYIRSFLTVRTKLIDYVKDKIPKSIITETDSDADMFYKKYGFNIKEHNVSKSNFSYSRYVCTLKISNLKSLIKIHRDSNIYVKNLKII